MKLENIFMSLLLLGMVLYIHSSTGSAGVILSDLSEINSRTSVDTFTAGQRLLHIRPEVSVEVRMGSSAYLQCGQSSEGLMRLWMTPFGSFRDGRIFRDKDPININNRTLRISKATSSHTGLYHCQLVDDRGTAVVPYRLNVVDKDEHDKAKPRPPREAPETEGCELASGVVPAVLVSFVVAFTLGAFSRPYVIQCLHKTRPRMLSKPNWHTPRIAGLGPFRTAGRTSSMFQDSGAAKASTTSTKSPLKWFWSKKENQEPTVQETEVVEEAQTNPEPEPEDAEPCIQLKRRSRVIKVYNYDEEGKKYDHLTDPEVLMVEEHEIEPKPRLRVMSLTRLSTIMSQVDTPDFSTYRKSRDNTPAKANTPAED